MASNNQIGLGWSLGFIWMNTGNWLGETFSFTTSYQELTGLGTAFTLASPSQDFEMTTDGRLKYTGAKEKLFNIEAGLSYGGNSNYYIQIYKNGSPLAGSEAYGAGSGSTMLCGYKALLSTNDYISVWAKRIASGAVTIYSIALSAFSVEGM